MSGDADFTDVTLTGEDTFDEYDHDDWNDLDDHDHDNKGENEQGWMKWIEIINPNAEQNEREFFSFLLWMYCWRQVK